MALLNLQNILEDSQAQNESRLQTQLNVITKKYEDCKKNLTDARNEIETLIAFKDSLAKSNEKIVSMQEELDAVYRDLQHSKKELDPLRKALNETLAQLSSFGSSEQNFIDKYENFLLF